MRFFRRRRAKEEELEEEIRAHLDLETKRRIEDGESPENASRSARRDFGNVALVQEATRRAWGSGWIDSLGRDLQYAFRLMRQAPGFTLVAVLTLALGIGANTAIFSVVNAAMLKPLPFPESERLVRLFAVQNGVHLGGISRLDMRDLAAGSQSFEGMVVYDRWRKNVSGIGGSSDPEETVVGLASGTYFELLRIQPVLGRLFTPEESVYGKQFVAAIGANLWRTRFSADPQILGKTLRINGETYTVVAVLPDVVPSWMDQTSAPISIWTPYVLPNTWTEGQRAARDVACLGRLKPGVSYEHARSELATLAARLASEHPIDRGIGVAMEPLVDTRAGPVRPLLFALCGAVAMVLLIACANLASLLLARNSVRSRELAVRVALGAGRWRLLRQLLLETLVLSAAGGVAGLGLALAAMAFLARIRTAQNLPYTAASNALPQFWSAGLDLRVLAFALGVSAFTAVLFGLAPAVTSTRVPVVETLKEGGRSGGVGAGRQRFRRILVIGEVGLTLMLVVGAALLVQTVVRLERQNPGFPADHLLLAHVFIPPARYPDPDAISRFCDALGERVRAVPGVVEASVTTSYPPTLPWKQVFTIPGSPVSRADDAPVTRFAGVDARYIATLGLKLFAGRDFAATDTSTSVPVAIVNEEFVRRFFPNQDVLGRRIRPGPPEGVAPIPLQDFGSLSQDITIVGVVRNFMNDGVAQPPAPQLFMLFQQVPGLNFGFKDIVVRTSVNPESIVPVVAHELKSLDAEIPLGEIRSMETHLNSQTADRRFTTLLLGAFAGLGILLAVVGAYGVVSYLVSLRTQELGVRLALGARSANILWLVLRSGLSIGLAGIVLGFGGALALRHSLGSLLYGVGESDPMTFTGAAVLLLLVIAAASAVPAARAVRINPVEALRR
ncbi:MAG TPA: ABC transporter permease [Thermoanaerobaculia bacterium]